MILDARQPERPAGVLYDHGTGKRVPFARKVDFETGEYEAIVPSPDGQNYSCDEDGSLRIVRGHAVGKLELVPFEQAKHLGRMPKPERWASAIEPMTADQKRDGLRQYQEVFVKVNREVRHKTKAKVEDEWARFLRDNSFLDEFVIKRK